MGSTYTNNGGIELIGLGEQAGAWGTTTNNNFNIIDRLINGVVSITLTSGGTSKLITSDGSLSDGMNKIIVLGGSPDAGHIITIEPESAEKLYFVKNGTSQDIAFSQGSGGNATVKAGKGAIIFADGGSGSAAVTDLTALFVNSQAIDGAVIGGTTPAAITGTTITGTTITASTSILPDAEGGADIGSTSAEFGHIYIADDKKIQFGSDQDVLMEFDADDTGTLLISGGDITIADDKKLNFGTDKDVSIEYDEDGTDTMLITGDVTFADGSTDVDIASHDGTNGLKLGGNIVTRTAAQINAARSGTVTSVAAGTGLSGGTITSSGTISVNTTIGAVGTYAFLARKMPSGLFGIFVETGYSTIVAGQTYTNASSGAQNNNANLVYAGFLSQGSATGTGGDGFNHSDNTSLDSSGSSVTTGLTGIWRAMGEANAISRVPGTLFLRIS